MILPAGTWFVKGPIHVQSNVNPHLEEDAAVKFSTEADDYLPNSLTRYEGIELMNYSPLIYAYDQKNIAGTGKGNIRRTCRHRPLVELGRFKRKWMESRHTFTVGSVFITVTLKKSERKIFPERLFSQTLI